MVKSSKRALILQNVAYVILAAGFLYVFEQSVSNNGATRLHYPSKKWKVNLKEVTPVLERFVGDLASSNRSVCDTTVVGSGWGAHSLCNPIKQGCIFYSFGISSDYSFDSQLAEIFGCSGFAADPTVSHNSSLHPLVTFHQIGAKMLHEPARKKWFSTSMPSLMKWRRDKYVDILKMDCEGCEYSLARDVLSEDPTFFHKIGQFAFEIHVSKVWIATVEEIYALGKLFELLYDAGLHLAHASVGGCASYDEAPGCLKELIEIGMPCGQGKSCHNYLFGRKVISRPVQAP